MLEKQVQLSGQINAGALGLAIRSATGGRLIGISTYGDNRPVSLWFEDTATESDLAAADAVILQHDPVFLQANKLTILADGSDKATVLVTAPKPEAAPVILLVNGVEIPVTITDFNGTIEVVSLDRGLITVALKNGANRCAISLEIIAI